MENEELEEYIDYLVSVLDSIDTSKVTILTGKNGSGKSLIRKQLGLRLSSDKKNMKSISMNLRTSSNTSFGALGSIGQDLEWMATSNSSYTLIQKLFKSIDEKTDYICLDEFEIGCSEETVLALTNYINNQLSSLNIGCLIITHSRLAVDNLNADEFINLEGKTKDEWLSREIIPTNLDDLSSADLFRAIRNRTNSD